MESYEILTGVGELYIAPVGEVFPAVNIVPSGLWRNVGNTQDGVKITLDQKVDEIQTDQETGGVKAVRSEESMTIETKLAIATLENLADLLGNVVTTTAPGSGTIGKKKVGLYRTGTVNEYSFLFRGFSPYGAWQAQFEVPRAYVGGSIEHEYAKDANASYSVEIHALVDLDASLPEEKFGRLVAQSAAAL